MKSKFILFVIVLFTTLYAGFASGATVTITNSGFTFAPADVTINFGDIIDFQLGGSHNAVEVSETTWLADGNTPLPGFSTPFGGGQVTNLAPGVHFYVCSPHASLGMKGKITVNAPQGIEDPGTAAPLFSVYPNPTSGICNIVFIAQGKGDNQPVDSPVILRVTDYLGREVLNFQGDNVQEFKQMNIATFPDGFYFVKLEKDHKVYTRILVKKSGC